jgi:hypothetical protein
MVGGINGRMVETLVALVDMAMFVELVATAVMMIS